MPAANKQVGRRSTRRSWRKSPLVPLFTPKLIDFISTRVGNYQFSKQFYMLVAQLWVK